jgi:hypothetical protein
MRKFLVPSLKWLLMGGVLNGKVNNRMKGYAASPDGSVPVLLQLVATLLQRQQI